MSCLVLTPARPQVREEKDGDDRHGKTALDYAQDADDVKEALLSYRFSSEVS